MKRLTKILALLLIAALVLGMLAACGGEPQETGRDRKKDGKKATQQTTDAEDEEDASGEIAQDDETEPDDTLPDETEPEETEPEDLNWSYLLTVETVSDDRYSDDGTLLVSVTCECPVLMLTCDGDASSIPPAEMQNVCDVFNETMSEICSTSAADDIAEWAEEDYGYGDYFYAYEYSVYVTDYLIDGDLAEVMINSYFYSGGAHGGSSLAGYHFDLLEGDFFTLSDLTDDPAEFAAAIAEEIIAQIDASGEADFYFPDYKDTIRSYGEFYCLLGSDSMTVIFGEYDIAPYAEGIKTFEIPYDFVSSFLNARGERLLFGE